MPDNLTAYEGNEPFVFISYAHKDTDIVLPLIRGLCARGVRVWYDGGVEVGTEWPDFIAEHLEKSCCVLAFVSRNFGDSHNCRREINFAIDERKEPIVIYLEPRELLKAGMRMQLGSLHALFYDRYPNGDAFLNALLRAEIVKPCIGTAEKEVPSEPQPVPFATIEFADEEMTTPSEMPLEMPQVITDEPVPELHDETPEGWFNKAKTLRREKKYEEAVVWCRKAAEQGHKSAQFDLGWCYSCGKGIDKNLREAAKWYRKAAEQGHVMAQFYLGGCYAHGRGVLKSMTKAVKWYRKAAEQGHKTAQFDLGWCYENGKGVVRDVKLALEWYRKAKVSGAANADEAIARCENTLK